MEKENSNFSQKLSTYVRLTFLFDDELTSADGRSLITEAELSQLLIQRAKIISTKNKLINSLLVMLCLNVVLFRGTDFEVVGVSLLEVGGAEVSAFLAGALALILYMTVMFFQTNQFYGALLLTMQSILGKESNIDASVSNAWVDDDALFLKSMNVPFRFSKTDNVVLSSAGVVFYTLTRWLSMGPLLIALLSIFPISIFFLISAPKDTFLCVVFLIVGWFAFVSSIVMLVVPAIEFTNTHTTTRSRFTE